MVEHLAAVIVSVSALAGLWRLRRREATAGVWWFAGWIAAALSGVLYLGRDALPALGAVGLFTGVLSPALILLGVMVLVGRAIPSWVLPAALAVGVTRTALALAGLWPAAQVLGLVIEAPFALMSGWLAHRSIAREHATVARRLLAPSLIAVAILGITSVLCEASLGELPTALGIAWLMLVPPTFALQLSALTEHNRDVLVRAGERLERRVEERTAELDRAIGSLEVEIAERRAAEATLRETEERYRNVSELSSDFSFQLRLDKEHGIQHEWVTEAFEQITGFPPSVLDGDGWTELLEAEEQTDTRLAVDSAVGTGTPGRRLHKIIRADGEPRWLSLRFHTHRSEADGAVRVIGAATDVTDAKHAEDARIELLHQMDEAQRVESLGLLTGGIAHDFNNLLAVILGNVRLVRDELPADSANAQKLTHAHAAATHAVSLTEQMLSYSGKPSVSLEPVDVSTLVRELEELLRASVGPACQLTFELAETVIVEGDPIRLRQVLVNLATNASESLESRTGQVRLRTGRTTLTEGELSGLVGAREPEPGEYVWLEVSDDGAGMAPELQHRIFEPFYTTKFSGRGLGLASSLGIIRAHRGVISLDSELGRGTCVRVLIPAHDAVPTAIETPTRTVLRGLRILVVDDDDLVLELATELLEREGCIPVPALGGQRALELFSKDDEGFDAAVIDLAMPELDGRALYQELRRTHPVFPVVLATGYSRARLTEHFADEPHLGFLSKPYEVQELVRALSSVIDVPSRA